MVSFLPFFAAQPSNHNSVHGLENLQVEIKKYKNAVLLGWSWISVSTPPKGVFCLLISTSLIFIPQEGTGVCSLGGGIDVDTETDFKAHVEFLTAPALNISLR